MDLISRCLLHKKRKIVFKIYIPFTNDVCLPTKEKLFEGYLLPSTKWGQKLEENKVAHFSKKNPFGFVHFSTKTQTFWHKHLFTGQLNEVDFFSYKSEFYISNKIKTRLQLFKSGKNAQKLTLIK